MKKQPTALACPGAQPCLNPSAIPTTTKINIAQLVVEAIQRDFQRPEVQEDYLRWKQAQRLSSADN